MEARLKVHVCNTYSPAKEIIIKNATVITKFLCTSPCDMINNKIMPCNGYAYVLQTEERNMSGTYCGFGIQEVHENYGKEDDS